MIYNFASKAYYLSKIMEDSMSGMMKLGLFAVVFTITGIAHAKPEIWDAFFAEYPAASNSALHTLSSANANNQRPGHCGICHFDFTGGGTRNPYGLKVEENVGKGQNKDYPFAIQQAENIDSDGDGFFSIFEVTNTTYANTPTFPGLSAANVSLVSNVDQNELLGYLTPASGEDNDAPVVEVLYPNGGEILFGNSSNTISWTADDGGGSGIAGIEIYVSLDNGASYTPIAKNLPGSSENFTWFVSNRPTSNALIKVEAIDNSFNEGEDTSDSVFIIQSPGGGIAPTTLRDFDQPGSQPIVDSGSPQANPDSCGTCHGGYDSEHEPYRNWMGSMMAQASIDPIFKANLAIAQQDAPDSGDLCLRCHNSRGWLDGRSTPTDGSGMTELDQRGVSCDLCHRMVDPVYQPGLSPTNDYQILDELETVPEHPGNGMYVFDPNSHRRGPFSDSVSPHTDLYSPFHSVSAICRTCHDVSNPAFSRNSATGAFDPNAFDAPDPDFSPHSMAPVERTYSEWLHCA